MKVVAVANQKGGVGKTTTAINLSAALAVAKKKILIVDLDPQGNASSGLGIEKHDLNDTTYEVLIDNKDIKEAIVPTDIKNLSILPTNSSLAGAEIELVNEIGREFILKEALKNIKNHFDFVIIDCPPSLSLLTINALCAADVVLLPVQAEFFAMEGMAELLKTIERVRMTVNQNLEIAGILLTMVDERTKLSSQVINDVQSHFGDLVYKTSIPRNVRLGEAPSFGRSIFHYDVRSRGAVAYLNLAKEFLRNEKKRARARA